MLNKINHDILKIVYRYEWQSKINKVNEEYHESYELASETDIEMHFYYSLKKSDTILKSKLFYKFNGGEDSIFFNKRPLSQRFHNHISHFDMLQNSVKYVQKYQISENYNFTSTKYLREIKESGIECLAIK